ncbi:MAG TPA: endonuclease/exonuclease/phosphatase family protein [Polyangiaceae bacterium]|nr:endonuclease/exonuclease/phosphatase family protein [Polyangiaceae bacterium]
MVSPLPTSSLRARLALTSQLFSFTVIFLACGEPPLRPRPPSEGAPHFTVMTYNIELGAKGEASTLDSIGAVNADIACLQEVTPAAELAMRERFTELYPYQLFEPQGGAGGLAVLSRFPLEDRGLLLAPEDWHPSWRVDAQSPAGPVQLLNIHLRSLFSADTGPLRSYLSTDADHLTEMKQFEQHCDDSLPAVVLGDFNEGVTGDAVQFLEQQGFRNLLPAFHPGQPTWRFPAVGGQLQKTYDHIFVDDHLQPLNAWVETRGQSDHLPVIAHVEPAGW